jgi:hypothetical protein
MVPARNAQSLSPTQWEPSIEAQEARNSTGITVSNVSGFTLYYIYSASSGIVKSRSPAVRTHPNFERIQVKQLGLKCFRLLLENAQESVKQHLPVQLLLPFEESVVGTWPTQDTYFKHLHNLGGHWTRSLRELTCGSHIAVCVQESLSLYICYIFSPPILIQRPEKIWITWSIYEQMKICTAHGFSYVVSDMNG